VWVNCDIFKRLRKYFEIAQFVLFECWMSSWLDVAIYNGLNNCQVTYCSRQLVESNSKFWIRICFSCCLISCIWKNQTLNHFCGMSKWWYLWFYENYVTWPIVRSWLLQLFNTIVYTIVLLYYCHFDYLGLYLNLSSQADYCDLLSQCF